MPVVVVGLKEALKAMHTLQPELETNLRLGVEQALMPVMRHAQALVPETVGGLRNWTRVGKKETSKHFPTFSKAEVVRGITLQFGAKKRSASGFQSLIRIANLSRAGAIYETAGRKNPRGQDWIGRQNYANHKMSHSLNPEAGMHFINSLPLMKGVGPVRGRLIYKAWEEDHGRAAQAVLKVIDKIAAKSMATAKSSSWRREAA